MGLDKIIFFVSVSDNIYLFIYFSLLLNERFVIQFVGAALGLGNVDKLPNTRNKVKNFIFFFCIG